jgi:hypothetical protein
MAKVGLPVDSVVGAPRDGAGWEALVKLKLEKGFADPAGVAAAGAAPGAGGAVEDKEDSAALVFFHLLI